MRKIIFTITTILCINSLFGQYANNHWQLGAVDVNFTTNPAVAINNAGQLHSRNYHVPITTTQCDNNGNILFYTDGNNIWNKNHSTLVNGDLIKGNIRNVVIVPNPANVNQYYIFKSVSDQLLCGGCSSQTTYYYQLVEFSDTYPNGTVLPVGRGISRDVVIYYYIEQFSSINSGAYGPIAVTKNNTNDAYWLIIQKREDLLSYKIDRNGFNKTPIVSTSLNSGSISSYEDIVPNSRNLQEVADFKFTNNSKLIGLKYYTKASFYKLDFNNQTGLFTNFTRLFSDASNNIGSFEVSNNGNNIYFTTNSNSQSSSSGGNAESAGKVMIKDISDSTKPIRVLKLNNTTTESRAFSYLQKDRYQNILVSSGYSASTNSSYLHKIENQDSYSSSYVATNQIFLAGIGIYLRLPQLIPAINICQANKVVNNPITATQDVRVNNLITASSTVSNNITVNYKAAQVLLKPGFSVSGNSTGKFRAYVDPCVLGAALTTVSQAATNREVTQVTANSEDDLRILGNAKQSINVYPNPNNGNFQIANIDYAAFGNQPIQLDVTDISGRIVYKKLLNKSDVANCKVVLNHAVSGIYFVKLSSFSKTLTIKFIKN